MSTRNPNPIMKRIAAALLAALVLHCDGQVPAHSPVAASAPVTPVTPEPKKPWDLEYAYLSKYREANERLGPPAPGENRVVFMGDSITEGWIGTDPAFFAGRPYIDRGISGQTTSQMLVRFRQDVINLKPALVLILGGTNDIAQNGGLTTLEAIEQNLQSMAELAKVNGIRVAFTSVLPAFDYPWRRGLEPAEKISALNLWISDYCRKNGLVYADCYTPMADAKRGMRAELSGDGVHPNAAGYAVMDPIALDEIRRALR
jgi:lysophospholipase L1-like esterase